MLTIYSDTGKHLYSRKEEKSYGKNRTKESQNPSGQALSHTTGEDGGEMGILSEWLHTYVLAGCSSFALSLGLALLSAWDFPRRCSMLAFLTSWGLHRNLNFMSLANMHCPHIFPSSFCLVTNEARHYPSSKELSCINREPFKVSDSSATQIPTSWQFLPSCLGPGGVAREVSICSQPTIYKK